MGKIANCVVSLCIFLVMDLSEIQGQKLSPLSLNNVLLAGPKGLMTFTDKVSSGSSLALEECRHQFHWERWNCPLRSLHQPQSPHTKARPATRETAFVSAIHAAGVAHSLTRNCSVGALETCACTATKTPQPGHSWLWKGCMANFYIAEQVSTLFVDQMIEGQDALASVDRHNNKAGREAVRRTMKLLCKCHGVSGSCATKTCWRHLSSFRSVGDYVKRKYRRAVTVAFQNGILLHTTGRVSNRRDGVSIRKADLVFLYSSPDYCFHNGSYLTLGRQCARSGERNSNRVKPRGAGSCKKLCRNCGLRVRKSMAIVKSSCDCKFYWCCTVKCKSCMTSEETLTCV